MNVAPGTIKKQLEKLEQQDSAQIRTDDLENERIHYRNAWLRTVQSNVGKTKTEMRRLAQAEFTWLYRHDSKWLNDNSPKPLARKKYKDTRVDWIKRDREIFRPY